MGRIDQQDLQVAASQKKSTGGVGQADAAIGRISTQSHGTVHLQMAVLLISDSQSSSNDIITRNRANAICFVSALKLCARCHILFCDALYASCLS